VDGFVRVLGIGVSRVEVVGRKETELIMNNTQRWGIGTEGSKPKLLMGSEEETPSVTFSFWQRRISKLERKERREGAPGVRMEKVIELDDFRRSMEPWSCRDPEPHPRQLDPFPWWEWNPYLCRAIQRHVYQTAAGLGQKARDPIRQWERLPPQRRAVGGEPRLSLPSLSLLMDD